jgi:hypothetical protein
MRIVIALSVLSLALVGCKTEQEQSELRGTAAMRSGETIRNAAIEQAIISQHTLYPYHFITNSPELNELGWRDLGVLVRHFAHASGDLNLARGTTSDALYEKRAQALLTALRTAGIAKDRVAVVEGRRGGAGISGTRRVRIIDSSVNPLGAPPRAGGDTGSAAGMSGVLQ